MAVTNEPLVVGMGLWGSYDSLMYEKASS